MIPRMQFREFRQANNAISLAGVKPEDWLITILLQALPKDALRPDMISIVSCETG